MPFDIESSAICHFQTFLNYSISPFCERFNVGWYGRGGGFWVVSKWKIECTEAPFIILLCPRDSVYSIFVADHVGLSDRSLDCRQLLNCCETGSIICPSRYTSSTHWLVEVHEEYDVCCLVTHHTALLSQHFCRQENNRISGSIKHLKVDIKKKTNNVLKQN